MNEKIESVMTVFPHSIGLDQPLQKALSMMQELDIRHLPVRKGGKLVGVLSDRDLKMAQHFGKLETISVEDAMVPDPYVIPPETPVSEVAQTMADQKIGSALIVNAGGELIGIFTGTDSLRLLSQLSR